MDLKIWVTVGTLNKHLIIETDVIADKTNLKFIDFPLELQVNRKT